MGSVRSLTLPINTLIYVTKATQETRSKLQDELKIDDALEEQLRAVKTQIALKAQDLEEALNKTGRLCDHLRRRHLTITYENENYRDLRPFTEQFGCNANHPQDRIARLHFISLVRL